MEYAIGFVVGCLVTFCIGLWANYSLQIKQRKKDFNDSFELPYKDTFDPDSFEKVKDK